jgi:peptidyl-prolyl cis-trans isomerase B (cyclophilin B)
MSRLLALLFCASALTITACGGDSGGDVQAPPSASQTAGAAATSTAAPAPQTTSTPAASASSDCAPREEPGGGGKALPCPTPSLIKGKTNVVEVKTSQGSFEITLDQQRAPATANSVAYLTKKGFYDGLDFHRVVPDFVIQGGDPNGDGSGGPGYQVTETPPSDLTYTRGIVAMAKGGTDAPGASGSQFFVVSGADAGLPPEYALVGKVTKGLGTVDKISALGQGDGPPSKKVTIDKMTLVGR